MIPNPKYKQHLQQTIQQASAELAKPRHGIIVGYDYLNNTASVMLSSPDSETPGDIIKNVICPSTRGIQAVAPSPGYPCWVAFKGDREKFPVILSFFNHNYEHFDYKRQYDSVNYTPKFMLSL